MSNGDKATVLRFGVFELDTESEQLLKNGLAIRLKPQPFKLLKLLVNEAGRVVTREEIRAALWTGDTFVDFDQGVNFAIKQVREALNDPADRPLYIQTVPKRGYRFIAPVGAGDDDDEEDPLDAALAAFPGTDPRLHKALWADIVELREAEERRNAERKKLVLAMIAGAAVLVAIIVALLVLR